MMMRAMMMMTMMMLVAVVNWQSREGLRHELAVRHSSFCIAASILSVPLLFFFFSRPVPLLFYPLGKYCFVDFSPNFVSQFFCNTIFSLFWGKYLMERPLWFRALGFWSNRSQMSIQEDSFSVFINQSTQVEFFFFLMPWHSTEAIIDVCVRTHTVQWHQVRQPFPEVGIGDHGLGPEEENGLRNGLSWLRPVWRPRTGFGGNYRWPKPRSVDRLLHTSKERKSKCLQSQAEARQVWSREAKSLWSQQDSICPAARQLLAGNTYLAVKAKHFRQAELFVLLDIGICLS